MKKIILAIFLIMVSSMANANETVLEQENTIQKRINEIGANILNQNRITKRVVFTYNKSTQKKVVVSDKTLSKRQIIVYENTYKHIENDDELAAMLAREISLAVRSYDGAWGGRIDSFQVTLSPKKFETVADKRAVDYLVNAGYNPLAVITYINKSCPQCKSDAISKHNLTSKRLARVYEYITYKYPQYLENNEYINNKNYQNFLLTSVENRKKLEHKIKTNSTEELKYE